MKPGLSSPLLGLSPDRPAGRASALPGLLRALLALPVLVVTAIWLLQLAIQLAAGDAVRTAGRAALEEAVMPRATCRSITAAAHRRLAAARLADRVDSIGVEINGRPRFGATRPGSGDRVVVAMSWTAPAAMPDLLGPLGLLPAGGQNRLRLAVRVP